MPAPKTAEAFLLLLEQSRLLAADQLGELRVMSRSTRDPAALAQYTANAGWITSWQSRQLLAGGNAFFLGRYKLLDRIGAGARGKVYRAEQSPLDRIVAIKVFDINLVDDVEANARWEREVRIAARLNHPSIVTAYDSETVGKIQFLVMEYVPGKDLKAWVDAEGALPISWACTCIHQAAGGLQHAHEHGVLHRDIKAGNLLVVARDTKSYPVTKILDLGLARIVDEDRDFARITHTWQTFGTPEYMAPEQAASAQQADERSDIFSLGCTLYRMLAGKFPFGGVTKMQKLMAKTQSNAVPLQSVRPQVPDALAAIVHRMLERMPSARQQSAREVEQDLEPFILPPPE